LEKSGADFRLRNTTGATLVVHSVGVSVTGPSVPAGAQFPPAPVITSPAAFATVPTGSAISGTTEPDGTVTVSEGTTVRCTATASHTGSWSCTPATPLTVGQHSITGKVTDPNGLVGKASAALTFIASDQPAGTATVGSVIGVTNYSYGMSEDEVPSNGFDGPTTAGVVAGRTARTSVTNNMYFDVDNSVAFAGFYQATWTVNYYDQGTGSISVQYDDGSTNPYSPAATTLPLTNTNTWKTATTTTTSAKPAYFGGKQHSAADFRLRGSVQISVHSVAVKITGAGVPSVAKFAPAPVITSPAAGTTAGSTTPTISGTSEPAATVNVAEGSTPVCQATATDTGSWSCTPGNGLAGGQHTIVATATDFTSTPAPASGSVTFAIPVPTGAIVGTVTDAAGGAGLGNVCVYLYVPGNSTSAAYATCTRTNGGYTLTGVPAASYNVAFYDPAGAYVTEWYDGTSGGTTSQGNAQTVTISANGTATINAALSLVVSGYLSGTVRDTATGKTLGDICAYVYPAGSSAAAAYATCTLADGSYQLGPIAPADYNIAFYDPAGAHATQWYAGTSTGSADQEHAVAVTVTGGNHTVAGVDANLTLVPVGTISGAVTAASDSSPLGGVCVFLYRPNDASSAAYATCTAGDGSYSLGGVTAGSYNVAFYDPAGGYLTQWYDGSAVGASSQAEASTVTINAGNAVTGGIGAALPAVPSGVVTGKVTDATTSAPLGNVCVYFYQAGNTAAASYATCTLADGTYGIANVSAGNYNAAFYDPSGVHATQWFDGTAAGAASRSGATVVTVNGGNRVTSNVNAVLGPTG
jgi:hypothetical protein